MMKRIVIGVAALAALSALGILGLAKYRPEWVLVRVIPIVQAIKSPVGPPRAVHWQAGPAQAANPPDARPPNIIIILADDLGWNGVSRGDELALGVLPTPHISAIAKHGVAFANAYAGSAICAPSRAALMTGRYATRFGYEFTPTPDAMIPVVASLMRHNPAQLRKPITLSPQQDIPPFEQLGMPLSEITMAQALQQAGYHTVLIGKWHLGESGAKLPFKRGFDESLKLAGLLHADKGAANIVNAVPPYDPVDKFLWSIGRQAVRFNGGPLFSPKGYLTDYFTDQAVKVIHANRNRPFFLYLAHWAVHAPLQAKRADVEALPQIENHAKRVYAAMIRALDRSVGRIMQALEREGLRNNTLVIFTSDNGAPGYMGLPKVNAPFRGWKLTFFEGGLHVPFYLQWPARIQPGQRYGARVHFVDIFSTVLGAANAALPADRKIDGVNLLPYVRGAKSGPPHDTLFWRNGRYYALIDGRWKLQVAERLHKTWLFDLKTDPTEQHNVAARYPRVVTRMKQELARIDAQQAQPLWPARILAPITVDKNAADNKSPEDAYVLWAN